MTSSTPSAPPPAPLLAGIRVVDLSQYLPGPLAAQILADLGADVVKIEPPDGDPTRRFDPPADPDGLSATYKLINAGKRVLRLDLKQAGHRATAAALLAGADVLIESFRPGTLDRLGLGRTTLANTNPGLIHAALTGWGQTGPYAGRAGHDLNFMAVAGGMASSGTLESPGIACPPTAAHAAAIQAALAVTAALFRRHRTGLGAFLDLSLMETVLGWQGVGLTFAARGIPAERGRAMATGGAACYRVYRTGDDRFVALAAFEPKYWERFCLAVGRPDWVGQHGAPLPQTALIAEVQALFAARSRTAWEQLLTPLDCCFDPVLAPGEVPDHPQVAARGQIDRQAQGGLLVASLLGLRVDGASPPRRTPVTEIDPATALSAWT